MTYSPRVVSTYSPRVVANAILASARDKGISVSHLKLQKLMYFIHCWGLTLNGKSPINEMPQAWQYGPTFESIFFAARDYGQKPIKEFFKSMDVITNEFSGLIPSSEDKGFWGLSDAVLKQYSHFDALEMSAIAHEEGGAWEKARKNKYPIIPDEFIIDDYSAKLEAHRNKAKKDPAADSSMT